jgi:hypothetical protein
MEGYLKLTFPSILIVILLPVFVTWYWTVSLTCFHRGRHHFIDFMQELEDGLNLVGAQ